MKKIKTFFHVFANSLLPSEFYYKKLIRTKFSFSLKYFLSLIFVFNCIFLTILFIKNINNLFEFKKSIINTLNSYPPDLTINIKNSHLITGYNRPYIMWFKYKNIPYPILVVDERANFEKINQYDSIILLNEKGIVFKNDNTLRINQFKPAERIIISKQIVEDFKNVVQLIFKLFPILALFFTILIISILQIYFSLIKILYLGLVSLIIFIMLKIFIKKSSYKKVLQISFHSSTIPIVLEFLTLGLGLRIKFPFWYPFLILIFLASAVYEVFLYNYNQNQELPHKFHPSIRKHSLPKIHIKKHAHK